jgi:hypothetical protein
VSRAFERSAEAWPNPFEASELPSDVENLPVASPLGMLDATPPELAGAPRTFGWPTAVVLMVLVVALFAFSFALLRTGSDPKSAVVIPLVLLFGAGVVVIPVTSTRVRTRLSAAARGALDGARGKK